MRIAITGASGYLASRIMSSLVEEQHALVCQSSTLKVIPGVRCIYGALTSAEVVDSLTDGADILVHCAAALGKGEWSHFVLSNVQASIDLYRAFCRHGGRKFIYVSSIESIVTPDSGRCTEDSLPRFGNNHYVNSKSLSEYMLREVERYEGVPIYIVRPGAVLGEASPFWNIRLQREQQTLLNDREGVPLYCFEKDVTDCIKLLIGRECNKKNYNVVRCGFRTWSELYDFISNDVTGVQVRYISTETYLSEYHRIESLLSRCSLDYFIKTRQVDVETHNFDMIMADDTNCFED